MDAFADCRQLREGPHGEGLIVRVREDRQDPARLDDLPGRRFLDGGLLRRPRAGKHVDQPVVDLHSRFTVVRFAHAVCASELSREDQRDLALQTDVADLNKFVKLCVMQAYKRWNGKG